MRRLILLLAIFTLALTPQTLAVVDLLAPATNETTSNTTFVFEYYTGVPNFQGCTLNIDAQQFPDLDAQSNAMNDVHVQNIAPGKHTWNVTCHGNTTETSESRTFTIDTVAPTVDTITPVQNSTTDTLSLDFVPTDENAASIPCTVEWQGTLLENISVQSGDHYTKTYSAQPGTGLLNVTCTDTAGNTGQNLTSLTLEPTLFFTLSLPKTSYGIREPVLLTIDTLPTADLTIDVCPNTGGFVQCTSALIETNLFPQTVTLPYMNTTGSYIVDGIARYNGKTVAAQATYDVLNTMALDIGIGTEEVGRPVHLTASVSGGVGPYTYTWDLRNGTTLTGEEIDVTYQSPGEYNITVTVTDNGGNTLQKEVKVDIEAVYTILFRIVDNQTGAPVEGAAIDFSRNEWTTQADGTAEFDVREGAHNLLVSAEGYDYLVQEYDITASQAITVGLRRSTERPTVTILSPQGGAFEPGQVELSYSARYTTGLVCTLLRDGQQEGEQQVHTGVGSFNLTLPSGEHVLTIACTAQDGKTASAQVTLGVQDESATPSQPPTTPTESEGRLQQLKRKMSAAMESLTSYNAKDQRFAELLGFDKRLRKLKRKVDQAVRDVADLHYKDGTDPEAERSSIMERITQALGTTPTRMHVTDSTRYVKYVKEETAGEVLQELERANITGLRSDSLLETQQQFTINSQVAHVEYTYEDGSTKIVTVVTREFTFADEVTDEYRIVEILPKTVSASATEIETMPKATILEEDPVIAFPKTDRVTLVIPGEVAVDAVQAGYTVLVRPRTGSGNSITGLAILSSGELLGTGWPVTVGILLLVLFIIAYQFNPLPRIKYVLYRVGKNEKVHYVRVLVNDAEDQLTTHSYDKAEMLYKEIRMTYDTLPELAQNELYEDVMGLVKKMDAYYFNMVMIELDEHLKLGDMELAIDAYEKLLGTFERLDDERQQQLVAVVTRMAERLGVAA